MIDIICQIGIMMFGATAIFLVGTKGKWQRYGYLCGLIAQPCWYITTYRHEQWGIFFLSFFYTVSWINGFRNHFLCKTNPTVATPTARADAEKEVEG